MKKSIQILSVALLMQLSLAAQHIRSSRVPEKVSTAFRNAQPTVQNASWEREKSDFEVHFKNAQGKNMSLLFSPEGIILETEISIAFDELPKSAQIALKGKKVKEICKITNQKGKITYEAEVGRKDLIFSSEGKLLPAK